jgi:antitoxin (DNA-binding transcriptional repressor) of toxin-antitoxin stability system
VLIVLSYFAGMLSRGQGSCFSSPSTKIAGRANAAHRQVRNLRALFPQRKPKLFMKQTSSETREALEAARVITNAARRCATECATIGMMPTVNIRQLRDTRKLKALLRAGKTVELRERDKLIARIVPATSPEATGDLPDFAARRAEIFGDRVVSGSDLLIEERGRY